MTAPVLPAGGSRTVDRDLALDAITAEIFRYGLTAIPSQIDANIVRTAYSPLVYEYKDYAVGMVDHEGRLLSQSQGALPIFVANALGVAVRDGLETYGAEGFVPGDVVVTNHAGTLGQHLNNVVMFSPVFVGPDQADLFGFMAIVVHWIDVGGDGPAVPYPPTEIFQEGVQYRCLKLRSAGKLDKGVARTIEANSRFPRELWGDVEAQMAGCLRGGELLADLVDKYGVETSRAAVRWLWDRAEAGARLALGEIADGEYEALSFLDDNGIPGGEPTRIHVKVRVHGQAMDIDLSGCSDQVLGPINSGREGGGVAAARIAFKYLVEPDQPANEGAFRPLSISVRDGTFLSASATAPMNYYSLPLPTVIDTILRALAPALPGRIAGGHHGAFGLHAFTGRNPHTGALFQCFDTALGGWGATARGDGGGPFKTMAHGDTQDVPVEAQEFLYPILVESFALLADSGGAGQFRGGLATVKTYVAQAPLTAVVVQDRELTPPWGLAGGHDGDAPATTLFKGDEPPTRLRRAVVALNPGDRVEARAGGGGGFGDPLARDPASVAADVRAGYVGRAAARDLYGVELDAEDQVLVIETERRRSSRRA